MLTSIEGYFLLNTFKLNDENPNWKLKDAIIDAQLNGEITLL